MDKIFFTSDLHFGHDRQFLYGPRGFGSIQEHDEAVIERWNSVVDNDDTVYVLGDLMLNDNEHGLECLRRLNGKIKIIAGNHDTVARIKLYQDLENVTFLGFADRFKYKKYNFYISHYPTMTSNLEGSPHLGEHTINLFGHTHQKTNFYNDMHFMYHVGLDSHDYYPVLIDDAIEHMKTEVKKCIAMLGEEPVEQATSSNTYTVKNYKLNLAEVISTLARAAQPAETAVDAKIFVRCGKCVHNWPDCGNTDEKGTCRTYRIDPPDGGYYG